MTVKIVRKVVKINEEKCNGCGVCVPSCAEGALKIIDGKARLVSDKYCDGLGACLGECPQGAITIIERKADKFDETAAGDHVKNVKTKEEKLACGCSSSAVQEIERCECETGSPIHQPSQLGYWPVQLTLVPENAPFLKGADVILAADCTAFAYAGFHRRFLKDRVLIVACPKLDDFDAHLDKLTRIVANSGLKSLSVVRMEVPCCSGLFSMARKALENANIHIPLKEIVITIKGNLKK